MRDNERPRFEPSQRRLRMWSTEALSQWGGMTTMPPAETPVPVWAAAPPVLLAGGAVDLGLAPCGDD